MGGFLSSFHSTALQLLQEGALDGTLAPAHHITLCSMLYIHIVVLLIALAGHSAHSSEVPASAVAHPPQECISSTTTFDAFPPEDQVTDGSGNAAAAGQAIQIVPGYPGVTVAYYPQYKVVTTNINYAGTPVVETYMLNQCNTAQPVSSQGPPGAKQFQIPLTAVDVSVPFVQAYLDALGVTLRVVNTTTNTSGDIAPCTLLKQQCGQVASIPVEEGTAIPTGIDAVFTSSNSSEQTVACTVVSIPASTTLGPLDGPAVLKYFGVFFNVDRQAEALSNNLTQAYNAAAASFSRGPAAGKPVLAWIQNLGFARAMQYYSGYGISFVPYRATLTRDAGAATPNEAAIAATADVSQPQPHQYYFAHGQGYNFPSMAAAAAAFKEVLKEVDIVIDETATVGTSAYTVSTFLSNFNISMADSAEYPFLANQQVYGISFGNNDIGDVDAGYASIHPDEILMEVVSAVQPAALPGFQRRFLRNIATNESYRPLTTADCPVSGCPPSPLANSHLAPLCAYVQACQDGMQSLVSSEGGCQYGPCSSGSSSSASSSSG